MANKIENAAMFVVREGDELKFASSAVQGAARIAPVYLDGERLEGVYSEVKTGSINGMIADAALSGDRSEIPAGIEARNSVLKKWAEAAKKANKAKKAGGASLLLLTLAACGGGGGTAIVVKDEDTISKTGDTVSIQNASAGAVVTVEDGANGPDATDTYVVAMSADGAGELRISFEDADDVVVLSSATEISGFSTIIVEKGTVDFTAVTLPADVEIIKVGSGVILTYDQFDGLASIELRDGATSGELTVIVDDLAQARLVDASSKVDAGINVDIDMAGDAGELSVAELVELQGLVGADEELTYSLDDTLENLVAADPELLANATSYSISGVVSGQLDADEFAIVEGAENAGDFTYTGPAVAFTVVAASSSVTEGGALVFTVTAVDANGNATTVDAAVDLVWGANGAIAGALPAADVADFVKATGAVSIAAGASSASFTVNVVNDGVLENDENFVVKLAYASDTATPIATSAGVKLVDDQETVLTAAYNDAKAVYDAAAVTAATSLAAAATAQAAADAAEAAVTDLATAEAYEAAAATAKAAADTAVVDANAAVAASAELTAAAAATASTADNAVAVTDTAAADAALANALAAQAVAAAEVSSAAAEVADYTPVLRTLTAGVDEGAAFAGGSGDDVYTATDVAHLQALDTFDGGAGTNTIRILDTTATDAVVDAQFAGVTNVQVLETTSIDVTLGAQASEAGVETLNLLDNEDVAKKVTLSGFDGVNRAGFAGG